MSTEQMPTLNPLDHNWILEFTFDPLAASTLIVFTANPDQRTKDREIVVSEIVNFRAERYHDAADTSLGDFRGVTIGRRGRYWRYTLDTGDAVITFDSHQRIEL